MEYNSNVEQYLKISSQFVPYGLDDLFLNRKVMQLYLEKGIT